MLKPLLAFDSSTIAQEMPEKVLREHPDLTGPYVAGGGITGALSALRNSDRAGKIVVVGYQLMEITCTALLDGSMTAAMSQPLKLMAQETVAGMMRACASRLESGNWTSIIPFEIYTRACI